MPAHAAVSAALADLQTHLTRHGLTCADFRLPMPHDFDLQAFRFRELRAELDYDSGHEALQAQRMRHAMAAFPLQAAAFDAIKHAIDVDTSAVFFVDGPGGTGKSFLFEALLHYVRGRSGIAVACSWNGLAASLLPGGRACHARFGFPVPLPRDRVPWNVTARSGKGQVLARAHILLWDEVGTAPAAGVDAADACLRDLCCNDVPFGGKIIVFGGDLRQTLPIVEFGERADIVASAFVSSHIWSSGLLQHLKLTSNIRADRDVAFRDFLLRVGDGREARDLDYGPNTIFLPSEIVAPEGWTPADLVHFVYNDLVTESLQLLRDPSPAAIQNLAARAVLTLRNDFVTALNDIVLDLFPSHGIRTLQSTTTISGGTEADYQAFPLDYLNSLDLPGFPPADFVLEHWSCYSAT